MHVHGDKPVWFDPLWRVTTRRSHFGNTGCRLKSACTCSEPFAKICMGPEPTFIPSTRSGAIPVSDSNDRTKGSDLKTCMSARTIGVKPLGLLAPSFRWPPLPGPCTVQCHIFAVRAVPNAAFISSARLLQASGEVIRTSGNSLSRASSIAAAASEASI